MTALRQIEGDGPLEHTAAWDAFPPPDLFDGVGLVVSKTDGEFLHTMIIVHDRSEGHGHGAR